MTSTYTLRPEVLDRARERLGCGSDEKLAHEIGVSSGTIDRIRRGKTPGFATAIKLLEAAGLGVLGVVKHEIAPGQEVA